MHTPTAMQRIVGSTRKVYLAITGALILFLWISPTVRREKLLHENSGEAEVAWEDLPRSVAPYNLWPKINFW